MHKVELQNYMHLEKRELKKLRRKRHRINKLLVQARGPRWFAHAWTSKTGIALLLAYIVHSIYYTYNLGAGTPYEQRGPEFLYYLFILIGVRLILSFKRTTRSNLEYRLGALEERIQLKYYNIETAQNTIAGITRNEELADYDNTETTNYNLAS